jgi:hypothetical protein
MLLILILWTSCANTTLLGTTLFKSCRLTGKTNEEVPRMLQKAVILASEG